MVVAPWVCVWGKDVWTRRRVFLAVLGGVALATPNLALVDMEDCVCRLGPIQPVVSSVVRCGKRQGMAFLLGLPG
jgi:hypothetical protein